MKRFNLKGAIAALFCVASAAAQSVAVTNTYTYNGYPVYIAVDEADIASVATIAVPAAIKMTKVTVRVRIEYGDVGDLNLFLFSPEGTRVRLLERNCGGLVNVDTTFDETAGSMYKDFCPAEAGRGPFRGNEPISNVYSNESSLGYWKLAVENNGSNSRTGYLTAFSLEITGNRQAAPVFRSSTVLNSASARPGVIAPGENITILGLNLGPQNGVSAPAGALPTTLSGVRVNMGGIDIPISYVSLYRIDAQIPFGLSTSGPASLQVRNNDFASTVVSVNTQITFPGIYTVDGLGVGAAKAVNQNGKLNTPLNPAKAGETIVVYASGLGEVVPASTAGQPGPSSPLSVASQKVAASIGGVPAAVSFAGLSPGTRGIYQVNIVVPTGVPAGTRDIVISNGGNASQSQVTVEVQ